MAQHALAAQRKALFDLVSEGMSVASAAEALGMSRAWGYIVIRDAGICVKCGRNKDD